MTLDRFRKLCLAQPGATEQIQWEVDAVFKVDYRFWVLGLKPLDATRAAQLPAYLILWTLFFLVTMRALAANVAVRGEGPVTSYLVAAGAMSSGFIVLLAVQGTSLEGNLPSPKILTKRKKT